MVSAGSAGPHAASVVLPVPRSFLACLPYIWSQVLFPGRPVEANRPRWPALLLFLALPAILLYPCVGFLLFEPDEGRYAEIPREMLVRGEWIVPYLQGEPYLDKPPLLYWLVMASYRLFGVHDWSARLVTALAVHACILVTYLLGRRSLGERAAFWGALALCLAPGFVSVGRLLVMDGLLTVWVILAWFAAFEAVRGERLRWGWWLLAAVACGLGMLTKGPVAILLLVPPLLAQRWLAGCCRVGGRAMWLFILVVLAVSLPWYVAVCVRLPGFAGYFLWKHNVVRFLTPFDHQYPVWFYGPILLLGLLPMSLLGWGVLRFLLTGDPAVGCRRCPALGFMLLAAGWCVLFFSASGSKLPTYILPAFPPLVLALGYYVANSRWPDSRWTGATVGLAVLLLAAGHYVVVPWYAHFHSPMSNPLEVRRYCADASTPVVCYPRNCDSVAFYLGRDDLHNYRSKEIGSLLGFLQEQPRTVLLFTHRHSPESLRHALPQGFRLTDLTPLSRSWADGFRTEFCYMGVVERTSLR